MPLLLRGLGMRLFAGLVISMGLKAVTKQRADRMVRMIVDQDPELMVSAWREAMAFDSRPRLAEIQCPTLVVAGSNDQAVPIHHAKILHAGIAGSELVVIEGGDHALIWARPDDVARTVERFLSVPAAAPVSR